MKNLLFLLICMYVGGCSNLSGKDHMVNLRFVNASTNMLNWVSLEEGIRKRYVGVLAPGADSLCYSVGWKNIPDQMKITFIDDKTRKHYFIDLSFKNVNEQVSNGKCKEVRISILDYTKAEVICK